MIGKIFRPFSNDWTKFSGRFLETKQTTKHPADKTVGQIRQFPTFFEETTWTTILREERGREAGGILATKDTKGTKRDRKTSERLPHVREVRLSSRAPTPEAREGGVREIPECRCAASDAWECGRDVYIENQENRFADRNALGERMGGDNLDNLRQLFQGASPKPGGGWKRGYPARDDSGK